MIRMGTRAMRNRMWGFRLLGGRRGELRRGRGRGMKRWGEGAVFSTPSFSFVVSVELTFSSLLFSTSTSTSQSPRAPPCLNKPKRRRLFPFVDEARGGEQAEKSTWRVVLLFVFVVKG